MKSIRHQFTFGIFFLHIGISFSRLSISLDKETDLFRNWALSGDQIYFQNGRQLKTLYGHFPEGFPFKNFNAVIGIWAIFSNHGNENLIEPETPSGGKFSFSSTSQLIETVSVTYCLNHNSTIVIWTDKQETPFYKIEGTSPRYEFVTTEIPIGGSNRFTIEALTVGNNGFVLIDRIVGFYMEATTTRRPNPRTTKSPKSNASVRISTLFILNVFTIVISVFN